MGCVQADGVVLVARTKGAIDRDTPRLAERQLDKMVELHDRYGLSYRAIGTRYGMSEKMAYRAVRARKEALDGQPE